MLAQFAARSVSVLWNTVSGSASNVYVTRRKIHDVHDMFTDIRNNKITDKYRGIIHIRSLVITQYTSLATVHYITSISISQRNRATLFVTADAGNALYTKVDADCDKLATVELN